MNKHRSLNMAVLAGLFPLFLAGGCASAPPSGARLTVERIFDDPDLNGPSPRALKVDPDGSRVTYLKEKASDFQKLDLWEFDLSTGRNRLLVDSSGMEKGEEKLSDEEKARRERMRISSSGIVEYSFSKSGNALVFPLAGSLFYYPLTEEHASAERLTRGGKYETDAHLSPLGKYVSYVRDANLYLIETKSRRERPITRNGGGTIQYGVAEFIAQEEMDRFDGQWWADDDRRLAFTRIDEGGVEVAKRYEIDGDGFKVFEQRYPRTGTANVKIGLGVINVSAPGSIRWLDLGENPDIYLARVNWLPDGRTLAVQIESRDQKRLDLRFYDTKTGSSRLVLSETDSKWINLHDNLHFLKKSARFIWGSERSGFSHLYLYDLNGKLIRPLTYGNWPVGRLLSVDDNETYAYFTGSRDTPLERHLYRVAIDGGDEVVPVTQEPGWHGVSMSGNGRMYIDTYSNPMQPDQVSVHSASGERLAYIEENRLSPDHPLTPYLSSFSRPEFGSFRTHDGAELYYELYKPRNFREGTKYPVVVDVYGGPGVQRVRKAWGRRNEFWHQILAERGYAVLLVDGRGSANRGHAFETAIYGQLGRVEVEDQKAGVEFLVSRGIADPKRIGIFGWSYGGYMSLMSLLKAPETFHAAVSVAPVTDWSLYDTHYTERYLDTPAGNPHGYSKSGVLGYVDNLRGKLLMIHGMADDNVLFTNSTKIYKSLQDKALPFEMMAYPGSKHGIYGKKRQIHLFNAVDEFLDRGLRSP